MFLAFSKTLCLNYIKPSLTFIIMRIYAACSAGIMALKMHSTFGQKKEKSIFHLYLLVTLRTAAVHSTPPPNSFSPIFAHPPTIVPFSSKLPADSPTHPALLDLYPSQPSSFLLILQFENPKGKNNTCVEVWKCQGAVLCLGVAPRHKGEGRCGNNHTESCLSHFSLSSFRAMMSYQF